MKPIYVGGMQSPHFYTKKTKTNINGYSLTIEKGDVLVFDKDLTERPAKVLEVSKRNYNGVFEKPEHAKNAYFEASVVYLDNQETKALSGDQSFMDEIKKQLGRTVNA
jgi:hypothetical protein